MKMHSPHSHRFVSNRENEIDLPRKLLDKSQVCGVSRLARRTTDRWLCVSRSNCEFLGVWR